MGAILTRREAEILVLKLNRSNHRNAINVVLLEELKSELASAAAEDAVRAIVITGDENAFSAGQDLKEKEPPHFVELINSVFDHLEQIEKPTVAAIGGWCIAGGLELALCCDIRVCADNARVGDWHARINSIGGAGATVRLVRTIGLARAKELVFTGEALDAPAAVALGLVSHVYPATDLLQAAVALAKTLCVGSPLTTGFAKRAMNAAADLTLPQALDYSLLCQRAVRGPSAS